MPIATARPVALDLLPAEGACGGSLLPRGWIVATGSLVAVADVLDAWLDGCPERERAHHRGWFLLTHALGQRVRAALATVLRAVPGALPADGAPSPAIVVLGHPVLIGGADLRALGTLPSLLASSLDPRLAACLERMGEARRAQFLDDVRTAIGLLDPGEPRPNVWRQDGIGA